MLVTPWMALGMTEGWENVCANRAEFPITKALWRADGQRDSDFVVEKCEGAEGDVSIARGAVAIKKTNDKGYIIVTAPAFPVPMGVTNDVRLVADVVVEDGNVDTASGFLRAYGVRKDLSFCGLLENEYFAMGGGHKEMRGMVCTAPGMSYRKYAHYRAVDGKVVPVIVVRGTPSVSHWRNWTVEDLQAAQTVWKTHYQAKLGKDHAHERIDADAYARSIALDVEHSAEIRRVGGCARFFVDGCPATPILYKGKHMMDDGSAVERFAGKQMQENGIRLMVKEVQLWSTPGFPGFGDKGGFDMRACVEEIRNAMRISDKSLFLVSIDTTPYPEFSAEHPDEVWKKPDGSTVVGSAGTCTAYKSMGIDFESGKVWPWVSYASPSWRQAVCDKIRDLVSALKREGLSKRIIGVHFCGFHDGQFSSPYVDVSPCAQEEYKRFLKEPDVAATNYCWFSKQLGFRAQEDFARTFKREIGKPVVAVRWCESAFMNYPPCACDVTSFVNSDAIDVLVAQSNYESRRPGLPCALPMPLASFHLHGKMYWDEFDLRTYGAMEPWASTGAPSVKGLGTAEDFPMWQTMFRRLAGRVLARRMGWWFYDMGGGWFSPAEIAADIGNVARQVSSLKAAGSADWKPDVAIVIDEAGQKMWDALDVGYSPAVCDIYLYQSLTLAAAGVPYDIYLADDVLRQPSLMDAYKMVCFVHFNKFDDARTSLVTRLSSENKTLLFFSESGRIGGAEATGFKLVTENGPKSLRVSPESGCHEDVRTLAEVKADRNSLWGASVDRRTYIVETPGLKVVARYADGGAIAIAETDVGGSHRIYVAPQGGVSAELFNRWARDAKCYVATRTGVQVDMNGDFASVHCLRPGTYKFALPFSCGVRNLKSGRMEESKDDFVLLEMTAGETCWFGFESSSN